MSSKSTSPVKSSPEKSPSIKDTEIIDKTDVINESKSQYHDDHQKHKNISKLVWTDSTEQLLVKWGDTAACYSWLHDQSFRKFKLNNYFFSIPIIILSTITGTLNVGLQSVVPTEYIKTAQIAIGGVNIFTGIITTLQTFFRYAEDSETHFSSSVGWGKLQRNISVELSLERKFRKDAELFIRQCRTDYDRLLESSPTIPTEIIKLFKDKFKKNTDLIKPDICDEIRHIKVHASDPDPIIEKTNELKKLFSIPEKTLPEITLAVNSVTPGSIKDELENDLTNDDVAKFSNVMRRHSFMNTNYVPYQPQRDRAQTDFIKTKKDTPLLFESTPKPQINLEISNPPKVRDLIRQFQPELNNGRPQFIKPITDKAEDKVEIIIVKDEVEDKTELDSKPESKINMVDNEEKTLDSGQIEPKNVIPVASETELNSEAKTKDDQNTETNQNLSQDEKFENLYLNYGVKLPGLFKFKK